MTTHILAAANALCDTTSRATCDTGLPTVAANTSFVQTALAFLFAVMGAISVLVIIVGAIRIGAAQGDPQAVKKGRNTIIYALIGLVVAVSAEAIVSLVLGRI